MTQPYDPNHDAGRRTNRGENNPLGKQPNESNKEYKERVVRATRKAENNLRQFKQDKRNGIIPNGLSFDEWLKATNDGTDEYTMGGGRIEMGLGDAEDYPWMEPGDW